MRVEHKELEHEELAQLGTVCTDAGGKPQKSSDEKKYSRHDKRFIFSLLGSWKWIRTAWPARRVCVKKKKKSWFSGRNTADEVRYSNTEILRLIVFHLDKSIRQVQRSVSSLKGKACFCHTELLGDQSNHISESAWLRGSSVGGGKCNLNLAILRIIFGQEIHQK